VLNAIADGSTQPRPSAGRQKGAGDRSGDGQRCGLAAEGADGRSLVVLHVKDRVELGDLQEVVDFLGQMQQLQLAALVADGGEGADSSPMPELSM